MTSLVVCLGSRGAMVCLRFITSLSPFVTSVLLSFFGFFSIVFRRYFILNSVSLDSSNFSLSITRFLTLIRPPYRLVIGVFLRKWQVYSLSALFLPLSYLATLGARSPLSSPLSFDVLTLTHLVALLFCSVILGIHSALAGEPRIRDRDAAKRGPGLRKYIFNAQSQKTSI